MMDIFLTELSSRGDWTGIVIKFELDRDIFNNINQLNQYQFQKLQYFQKRMSISLDDEIRKDKQKQRERSSRHRHDNHRNYSHRNRYNERFSHWEHREPRQPRIFINISNLHYSVTREQLQELCEKYGRVKSCRIQWDKMGRSNEKATVEYFNRGDSENALQSLQGTVFEEQKIQLQLVEDESFPSKRHEIKKNYGNRFRQNSNNFKPSHRYK